MKIDTPRPPSFNRTSGGRRGASRRGYRRTRKAATLGRRMTWGVAKLGARAGASRAQLGRKRAAARLLPTQATGMIRKAAMRGGMTWRAAKLGVRMGESRARIGQKRAQLGQKRAELGQKRAQLGEKRAQLGQRRAQLGLKRAQRGRKPAAWPLSVQATGTITGATLMYFLDPHNGRRRRHVARDRMLKQVRRSGREASRKARYAGGVAEGKVHEAASAGQPKPQLDDTTLAHKVESEIFRSRDAPKGTVNLNAENGVVYLRGHVDNQEWIDRLIADARAVEGVHEVRSLLRVAQTS
jgi:osmotically-inducible protein OsmY